MRKTVICREGVYFTVVILFVFAGAVLREVNLLLLFASLLACPMYLSWRLGRKMVADVGMKRRLPHQIFAGDVFYIQVELSNDHKKLSAWAMILEDNITSDPPGKNRNAPSGNKATLKKQFPREKVKRTHKPAVYFEYIPVGESRKKSYAGRIPKRGRYRVGPMTVSTRFPFGFFRSSITQPESDSVEITVFPRLGRLSTSWKNKQHAAIENRQRRKFRASRVSGEFLGVRRWEQGDIRKWIHWRASAKHNQLVVRQFEQHQNRDAAILLDLYRPNAPDAREAENTELAISFAATLVNDFSNKGGSNLTFATFQGSVSGKNGTNGVKETDKNGKKEKNAKNVAKIELMTGTICAPLLDNIFEILAVAEQTSNDGICEMMLETLQNTDASADLILITHAPLDFSFSSRFRSLRNDPRFRAISQRIRIVDTSGREFDEFFSF